MANVTIQDVYTTGDDGSRKWVFNPGDSIQFNTSYLFSNDVPRQALFRVTWIVERYEQVTANNGRDIGFQFTIRRGFHADLVNELGSGIAWFNFVLDQLPDPLNLNLQDRAAFFDFIETDSVFLSFPGYWKLTSIILFTDGENKDEVFARSDAHYLITG